MSRTASTHVAWRLRLLAVACLVVVLIVTLNGILGGLLVGWLVVTLLDWRFRSVGGPLDSGRLNEFGRRLSENPAWTGYRRRLRDSARTRVLFVGGTAVAVTMVAVAFLLIDEGALDLLDVAVVATVSAAAMGFGVWLVCNGPDSDPGS